MAAVIRALADIAIWSSSSAGSRSGARGRAHRDARTPDGQSGSL